MNFAKAISIFITSIFTRRVIDAFMPVTPFRQTVVDIIFIRINHAAFLITLDRMGWIVTCWTLGSMKMATSPCLWIIPNTGGLFIFQCTRPRFPRNLCRRPSRPSLATILAGLYACSNVHFIDLGYPFQFNRLFLSTTLPEADWSWTEHLRRLNPTRERSAH